MSEFDFEERKEEEMRGSIEPMEQDQLESNKQAVLTLKEFVDSNYVLIRQLRENDAIHENFEKQLARIYDSILDIRFKLKDM